MFFSYFWIILFAFYLFSSHKLTSYSFRFSSSQESWRKKGKGSNKQTKRSAKKEYHAQKKRILKENNMIQTNKKTCKETKTIHIQKCLQRKEYHTNKQKDIQRKIQAKKKCAKVKVDPVCTTPLLPPPWLRGSQRLR